MQFDIDKALNEAEKEMDVEAKFDPADSRKTQITSTITTHRKVANEHFSNIKPSEVLDFGAGLGVGTREFGFDSYEPFPQRGMETYGWSPDYTDPSQINKEYKGLISNAVLNVIPNTNGERDAAVRAIGKALAPGGKAFVAARGKAFLKDLKNPKPYGDGVITSSGTFQKGFTRAELRDYISGILGPNFEVKPAKLGDMSVLITHKGDAIDEGTVLVDVTKDELSLMFVSKEQKDGRDMIGEVILDRDRWEDGTVEYIVQSSGINHKKYLGKGLGIKMYIKALETLLQRTNADYFTSGGMTTESAMRVWRSLFKNIDKHLADYPEIRESISLMPVNEMQMIKHPGGGKEEPSYERDVGSEPAYSIELYPERYRQLTK